MRLIISPIMNNAPQWAADYVAYKIKAARPTAERPFVMAIPAGSSPLGMFERLIAMFQKRKLSFQNVVILTWTDHRRSQPQKIRKVITAFVGKVLRPYRHQQKNVHLLDGQTRTLPKECASYEKRFAATAALTVGGVGEDGHIAFNEPGSSLASRTRVETLNKNTIKANARFLTMIQPGPEKRPNHRYCDHYGSQRSDDCCQRRQKTSALHLRRRRQH